jgi:hypothetical protein
MHPAALIKPFLSYANRLRFKHLFLLTVALFIIDLLVPDFIPMIDEIILALLAALLASLKKEPATGSTGAVIEGEVIRDEDR